MRAVEKRPVPLSLVDDVVKRVEREIAKNHNQEISSPAIGKVVLKYLRKIDKVAWLRFSSVYFQFEDLEDFEKLIEKTNPS